MKNQSLMLNYKFDEILDFSDDSIKMSNFHDEKHHFSVLIEIKKPYESNQ